MTAAGNMAAFPILSLITFLPSAGALAILLLVPRERTAAVKWATLSVSLATLILTLYLPFEFDSRTAALQWVEKNVWIERFGIHYYLGLDGISLPLVILTAFTTVICVLASWTEITRRVKAYMALFLFSETAVLGVFLAMDLFLFYVFWEVVLIPMVFIIGIWGSARRLYSSIKFFLFTFTGSLFMLLGILGIYFHHGKLTGQYTFDATILFQHPVPAEIQFWVFLALFLGFAVKVPMFPLHTWLPDAHTEAPTAGSILLAAVLLKLGTYGFMRFSLPLLPRACVQFAPLMITLSIIAILYGAWVTLAQQDLKKLVAYSSISHMGFVMLGLFVFNAQGLKGSLLQMINHGISTGALFLLVGMIYERTHRRMIADYGGLLKTLPWYGICFFVVALSSMGMPVTNGFIGELFVLIGAYKAHWALVLPVVAGVLLGAGYLLWMFQRVFLGDQAFRAAIPLKDVGFREIATLVPILFLIFWIGLYPKPLLNAADASLNRLMQVVVENRQKTPAPGSLSAGAITPSAPPGKDAPHADNGRRN